MGGPEEQHLIDRSTRFARKHSLPVYKNVLTPRTAGFCAAVDGAAVSAAESDNSLGALFDVTFAYSDPEHPVVLGKKMPPSVLDFLNGGKSAGCPQQLHVHVRRIPTSGERKNHPVQLPGNSC